MKLKNFKDLLEKRFTKKELEKIEHQAEFEAKALRSLQKDVKKNSHKKIKY